MNFKFPPGASCCCDAGESPPCTGKQSSHSNDFSVAQPVPNHPEFIWDEPGFPNTAGVPDRITTGTYANTLYFPPFGRFTTYARCHLSPASTSFAYFDLSYKLISFVPQAAAAGTIRFAVYTGLVFSADRPKIAPAIEAVNDPGSSAGYFYRYGTPNGLVISSATPAANDVLSVRVTPIASNNWTYDFKINGTSDVTVTNVIDAPLSVDEGWCNLSVYLSLFPNTGGFLSTSAAVRIDDFSAAFV